MDNYLKGIIKEIKQHKNKPKETVKNKKLTGHELIKRLDNEFDDVDYQYCESPTKGTVAVVYFYEKKLNTED